MLLRLTAILFIAAVAMPLVADDDAITVFNNVRVLSMSEAGVLENAAVTVQGSKIISVNDGAGEVPGGARVIDGKGMTLMPGLADMHVHYWSEVQGPLFLSNSVTTLRNMWGSSATFMLDAGAKRGALIGPHIYTPGPLMDGPDPSWGEGSLMVTSPEQAIGAVESQRTTGYKAVKLYEGLTPEIYAAAVKAARDRKMQVYTHVPKGMTVEEIIAFGPDSIEHFEGVSQSATTAEDQNARFMTRWATIDKERLAELASLSAEHGVWHSPTLTVIGTRYRYAADTEAFFSSSEAAYVGPGLVSWWSGSAARMGPYDEEKKQAIANQLAFVKMLYDADVPLLIGTDTPNPFVLPGFAIHDELAAFIEAGIPVDEVLRIATADAAKFLREEGQWGVVAADARADLVLLDADPREDLTTLRRPVGVMVNGFWYDAELLATEREGILKSVTKETANSE